MDPAIEIEDVIRHIVGVDAVNGVAHILTSGDDHRKGEEDHRADAPVQSEHGAIDVNMADLNQGLESEEYIEHVGLKARLKAVAVSARLRLRTAVDKVVVVDDDEEGVSSSADLVLGDLMWHGARSRSRGPIWVIGRPG